MLLYESTALGFDIHLFIKVENNREYDEIHELYFYYGKYKLAKEPYQQKQLDLRRDFPVSLYFSATGNGIRT